MKIKVLTLKNWCNKNITPLAWQRVIIKLLPQLRSKGFELSHLEDPQPELIFGDAELVLISGALNELYKISLPKEVTEKIQS